MIEKTEESENNNRSQRLRLFLCDNKGHMISQPPLQPAGQRFLLAPRFSPPHRFILLTITPRGRLAKV